MMSGLRTRRELVPASSSRCLQSHEGELVEQGDLIIVFYQNHNMSGLGTRMELMPASSSRCLQPHDGELVEQGDLIIVFYQNP